MDIHCTSIHFSYSSTALIKDLSFSVEKGSCVWIKGPSGSGKSSFLQLLAGYLTPDKGIISIGATQTNELSESQRTQFRFKNVGYVHQENHLIEHWTVQQNLELVGASLQKIESLMVQVSLDKSKLVSLVSKLSGGEKQRVSLIRLLIQKPSLALLDEPTAHLDDKNTEQILKLLKSEMPGSTIIIVSHDSRLSKHFDSPILFQELNR